MKEFEGSPCYAFFRVQSAGVLDFWKGFLPAEKSAFPPEEVTRLLELAPFRSHAAGDLRPDGKSRYNFSAWYGCGQAATSWKLSSTAPPTRRVGESGVTSSGWAASSSSNRRRSPDRKSVV